MRALGALAASALAVAACAGGGGSGDASTSGAPTVPLRSLGVHFNPETGLLVLTGGAVTTTPGQYPDVQIAFANVGPIALAEIPGTCRGTFTGGEVVDASSLTTKLQYRPVMGGAPLLRELTLKWAPSTLTLSDCGALDGTHAGQAARFAGAPGPLDLADDGRIWEVIPVVPSAVTGVPPSLPVRLPAQLVASADYEADGTWIVGDGGVAAPAAGSGGESGGASDRGAGGVSDAVALEPSAVVVAGVGTTKTAKYLGIRAGMEGARDQRPAIGVPRVLVAKGSASICRAEGEVVHLEARGDCDVILELGAERRGVRIEARPLLSRTEVDRPGSNLLDIKPLYITFKDGVDDRHDTGGLVASMVTGMVDFFAEQHPGFELRLDTYEGLPDIQHVRLPLTREQFLAEWTTTYGPLPRYLRAAGFDLNVDSKGEMVTDYASTRRIYVGIIESVTGGREGFASGHTTADCYAEYLAGGGVIFYARDADDRPCTERYATLRYRGTTDAEYDGSLLRRIYGGTGLRSLPGCEDTFRAYYSNPPEKTDESLVKKNDPVYYPQLGGKSPPWVMDEDHRFYLRITQGPRAGNPCWDIAYSPFWMRMGSRLGQDDAVVGRVTVDRPDDSTLPQVKAYYVLAADSVDDRFDVGGQIARQITTANEWLYANGGKRLRWDTHKGEIDVTFVRLAKTEAELWMEPDAPTRKCRAEPCPTLPTLRALLRERGVLAPEKIAAIFYGGQRTFASHADWIWCGAGGAGVRTMVYPVAELNVMTGGFRCNDMNLFATTPKSSNTIGLATFHEVFHVLGAVAFSGPRNGDGNGHIKGDPTDLMGGSSGTVRLDPGKDDYWRHGSSRYADLYESAFMEPAEPGAVMPPGW